MMEQKTAEELVKFIDRSPVSFQATESMRKKLRDAGFAELTENSRWDIRRGGSYYVIRGGSALIAFSVPEDFKGFRIMASHSDSPSFKIKENPEIDAEKHYVKLNVEKYGGMLMAPWFDRPLSVAGRVVVRRNGDMVSVPVDLGRDAVIIPNLAIHMNRDVNDGYKYNAQDDMLPLYGLDGAHGTFMKEIAAAAGVGQEEILGNDLFLYNRMPGTVWGTEKEFISAPRLDDLECAFCSLKGFINGARKEHIAVHCVFDNEEVGSGTSQGASSTFLKDTLTRIESGLGRSSEDYLIDLADSFMVSADNAHAVHPNHADKADPVNRPVLNGGIVLKFNANQKYCTDGVSAAMLREICGGAGVPVQVFTNRSDMPGGSTLGNLSNLQVPMHTADIGLAQLAMHSPYETAGSKDPGYLVKMAEKLFS
jgi:aspartyl aminopeptidase